MSTQFHPIAVDERDDDTRVREEEVGDPEFDADMEEEGSSSSHPSSRASSSFSSSSVRDPRAVKSRTFQCSRCAVCALLIVILTLMCASFFAGEYYALSQALDNDSLPFVVPPSRPHDLLDELPERVSSDCPKLTGSHAKNDTNQTEIDDDDAPEPNEDANEDSESTQTTSTGGVNGAIPAVEEVPNSATDNGVVAPEVEQEEQETELEIELEGVLAAAATDSFIDGVGLGAANNNLPKQPDASTSTTSSSPTLATASSSDWQQAPLPQFLVERCTVPSTPTQPFQYRLTPRDPDYYSSQYRDSDPNEPYLNTWVWPVTQTQQLRLQSTNDSSLPFHTNAYIPSLSPSAYLSSFSANGADKDWVANRERYEAILEPMSMNAAMYRDEASHFKEVDSRIEGENVPEMEWDQYQPMVLYLTEEDPESHPRCDGASGYHLLLRCYPTTDGEIDLTTAQPFYKSTPLQYDNGNGVYTVRLQLERAGSCYFQAFLFSWMDGGSLVSSAIPPRSEAAFSLKIKVKPAPAYDVSLATFATRILSIEADARAQRMNPVMPSKVSAHLISLDSAEASYRMLLHLSLLKRRRQECTTTSYLDYRSWGGAWYGFPVSSAKSPCAIRGPESFMPGDIEIRPAEGGDATDQFLGPLCSTDSGVIDQAWLHRALLAKNSNNSKRSKSGSSNRSESSNSSSKDTESSNTDSGSSNTGSKSSNKDSESSNTNSKNSNKESESSNTGSKNSSKENDSSNTDRKSSNKDSESSNTGSKSSSKDSESSNQGSESINSNSKGSDNSNSNSPAAEEEYLWLYAREDCYVHVYSPHALVKYWHDSHVQFVSGNAERDADDGLTKVMREVFSSTSQLAKAITPKLRRSADTEYVTSSFQALNPAASSTSEDDAIKQFCNEAPSAQVDPMEAFLTKVQGEKNSTSDLNSRCILALSNIRMNPPAASDSETVPNCGPVLNFSPLAFDDSANGTHSARPFEMNLAGLIMSFTEIMLDDSSRASYFAASEIDFHRRGVLRRPSWNVGYGAIDQHHGTNESEYLIANLESKLIEAGELWNKTYNGQCPTYHEKVFVALNESDVRPPWLLKKFQESLKGIPRNYPDECLPSGEDCKIAGVPTTFLSEFLHNAFKSLRQYFERIIKQHHERNRFIQELKHTLRSILFELQRRIDATKQGYEPPRGSVADSLFQLLRKSRADPPIAIAREELEDVPLLLPLPTMVLFRDEVVSPFTLDSNGAAELDRAPYVVQVANGELKNAMHLSRTPLQSHIFQRWNAKIQKRSTTHYATIAAAASQGLSSRPNHKKNKKKLELCMNVARDLSKVDEMWQYIDDQSIYSPFMLERQQCEAGPSKSKKPCMSKYHRFADRWSSLAAFHAMTLIKEQHIRHAFDSQSNFHTMHCKF